jgi:hypothetical protein
MGSGRTGSGFGPYRFLGFLPTGKYPENLQKNLNEWRFRAYTRLGAAAMEMPFHSVMHNASISSRL